MKVGTSLQAVLFGNFANVSNVNLMTYGQPSMVSSNEGVLTISSSGLITAMAPETAVVAASYQGLTATQTVTVRPVATQLGVLGMTTVLVDTTVLGCYAFFASRGAQTFRDSRAAIALERLFGAALILFGVHLMRSRR
jgi:threonine/homoserine/homoserine lactone efflux protein